MSLIQGATLAIAMVGAVLGVINTWQSLDSTRVKLKVQPAFAMPLGNAPANINVSVTVTNLSTFPVTINEVGFQFRGTTERAFFINPIMRNGESLPSRLEPRSSIAVFGELPEAAPGRSIKAAYAMTDCGLTRTGTSPGLRQAARERGL